MKGIIFSAVFIMLVYTGCSNYQRPVSHASPQVKVLLFQGSEIQLKPVKNYIISINSRKEMGEGRVYINYAGNKLLINDTPVNAGTVEIIPNLSFEFNGKKYGGSAVIVLSNNQLFLINTIDIETYLRGVLPNEVSPNWNMEVLKAQAIVSRTFALFEVVSSRKNGRFFDLYSDTRSQVYDGLNNESRFTSMAIDSTMGEVLRYEGRVIQSFFHSASGGMTESSAEVFGDDKPYLTPVSSPYSSIYKDNKWEASFPLKRMASLLRFPDNITSVSVTERSASKRIKTLEITEDNGKKTMLEGKALRDLIGPTKMKSTRANLRITNDNLFISGVGYGHGVGMGQWDALGMAKQGYEYKNILAFFYRGTAVDKIW